VLDATRLPPSRAPEVGLNLLFILRRVIVAEEAAQAVLDFQAVVEETRRQIARDQNRLLVRRVA